MAGKVSRHGAASQKTVIVIVIIVAVLIAGCFGAALVAALVLPALGQAQLADRGERSITQMSLLEQSRQALLNELDEAPESSEDMLQLMVDRDFITSEMLLSPVGPVTDGRGDYWVNVSPARAEDSPNPASHIAIYDRAMYEDGRRVGVCFYDGDCEVLRWEAFDALVNEAPNAGTDFNFPARR